jgi:hypothetical protein
MKYVSRILLIGLTLTLFSCGGEYYEKPIETWMKENLNDYSSYEPIEFIVFDSTTIDGKRFIETFNFLNLETAIQRSLDLMELILVDLGEPDLEKQITQYSSMYITYENLFETYNDVLDLGKNVLLLNTKDIELHIQLESVLDRIKKESRQIDEGLSEIGLGIATFDIMFDRGCIIYHKYRAKNSFGAVVLNQTLFVLSHDKSKVEYYLSIDQ